MILIADSGSTKTDWRLVRGKDILSFSTIGFNPYHISNSQILEELHSSELVEFSSLISKVFFYGAGCSSIDKNEIISEALSLFFINAEVEVNHDLLAAARASCGNLPGMTAILGTGSNSCLYDGERIVENIPALGYVLGDDGSGVDFGKMLLKKLFTNELSDELTLKFKEEYSINLNDILNAVYKEPLPNRFLAQFTMFIKKYEDKPEIDDIIKNCFHRFFKTNVCKYSNYQDYKLNAIGSVAEVFQAQLKEVALCYNVELGSVIKSPIQELVFFHTRN